MNKAMEAMREMIADLENGVRPKAARRAIFAQNPDGSLTRKIYDAEGVLLSTTILPAKQRLSAVNFNGGMERQSMPEKICAAPPADSSH